jgi:hypothetical protein
MGKWKLRTELLQDVVTADPEQRNSADFRPHDSDSSSPIGVICPPFRLLYRPSRVREVVRGTSRSIHRKVPFLFCSFPCFSEVCARYACDSNTFTCRASCGGRSAGRRKYWLHGISDRFESFSGARGKPPRRNVVENHPTIPGIFEANWSGGRSKTPSKALK